MCCAFVSLIRCLDFDIKNTKYLINFLHLFIALKLKCSSGNNEQKRKHEIFKLLSKSGRCFDSIISEFSAGKIQFFRCVSVAYFILMVFRYSFDFGFYIFSVHQFAQLLFSISIWREKFLRFIHLFVDIQLGFLYGILSSLSLDNVQLFENVKYGKEATANFVMWRIRNFNIIIFFLVFCSFRISFSFYLVETAKRER